VRGFARNLASAVLKDAKETPAMLFHFSSREAGNHLP